MVLMKKKATFVEMALVQKYLHISCLCRTISKKPADIAHEKNQVVVQFIEVTQFPILFVLFNFK